MSNEKKPAPMRRCFYCGEELGRYRDYDRLDTCGGPLMLHTGPLLPCDYCEGSGDIASELTFKWDGTSWTITMRDGRLYFIDQDFAAETYFVTGEDGKLVSDGHGSPESAMDYLEDRERENGGWA